MDYKIETLKVYQKNSDYYDSKFGEYSKIITKEINEIIQRISKKSKILDIGCGTGNIAEIYSRKGFDVLCLDNSDAMLSKCKEKGLKTIKMDLENIDFEKESFDVVWAYTSLLHIPKSNLTNVIDKIINILKNEGYFFISMKEGKGEGFVEFKEGGKRWFSLYYDKEIRMILSKKFNIIQSWKVNINNKTFLDYLCVKK